MVSSISLKACSVERTIDSEISFCMALAGSLLKDKLGFEESQTAECGSKTANKIDIELENLQILKDRLQHIENILSKL